MLEIFSFDFMNQAFLLAIIIGVNCALFSCFLTLKGWSLMGDALSHAVLPGVAITYILKLPLILGAFIAATLCSFLTQFFHQRSRVKEDTILGIVFSGMFALGLVLLSFIKTDMHLMHILFGNILGVEKSDFALSLITSFICSLILILKRKDFTLYCFDPVHLKVIGKSSFLTGNLLLILLSISIVSAIKAVGIILVIAMLIIPGATASLICHSMNKMMLVASVLSFLSGFFGVYSSYYIDSATAPTIVLLQSFFFFIVFIYQSFQTRIKV